MNATSGIDKMNQYNRVGEIGSVSYASHYGVFRAGGMVGVHADQPLPDQERSGARAMCTHRDSAPIKFHENFNITTVQPFAEFQLVAIPRWTITAGIKDAYFNMWLKQFADGKIVGL